MESTIADVHIGLEVKERQFFATKEILLSSAVTNHDLRKLHFSEVSVVAC